MAYNRDAPSGADCAAGGACGYGVYRAGCTFMPLWNAWKCKSKESG